MPSLPVIPPHVRFFLGIVAAIVGPAAAVVQPPWGGVLALVAIAAGLVSGAAVKVPAFMVGRPLLRGSFPVALAPLVYWLVETGASAPDPLEGGASLLVAVALSWLAGIPLPQPGQRPAAEVVADLPKPTAEHIVRTLKQQ